MIDKLPYTLTEGVTATRKGLMIDGISANGIWLFFRTTSHMTIKRNVIIAWPDAADRLRYREGEPACSAYGHQIVTHNSTFPPIVQDRGLHRIAAILCDDAEAFSVLHWCIHNMPKEAVMSELKRYEPMPHAHGLMEEHPNGPWVRYEDALAAIEQARREERGRIIQRLMAGARELEMLDNHVAAILLSNIATEIRAMPEEASDE
jgi:hypothetical protein